MDQPRFKVTITRENQPAHQMAEMSMTLPGAMLGNVIQSLIDAQEKLVPWLTEMGGGSPIAFGTWKSLTISRVDGEP